MFNSGSVFCVLRFEWGTRRFFCQDIHDEPSVDWLTTIGVPHSKAAPVTKFTGYLTRSKKIQWNFQRFSGIELFFLLLISPYCYYFYYYYFLFHRARVFRSGCFFCQKYFLYAFTPARLCWLYAVAAVTACLGFNVSTKFYPFCFNVGGYRRLFPVHVRSTKPRFFGLGNALEFVGRRTNVPYSFSCLVSGEFYVVAKQ